MALSALATAWSTWMSELHASDQAASYAQSAALRAEGSSLINKSNLQISAYLSIWDELVIMEIEKDAYIEAGNTVAAETLQKEMDAIFDNSCKDNLAEIFRNALAQDPIPTLFSQEVIDELHAPGQAKLDEAEERIAQGHMSNLYSDSFGLVRLFYSIVLFLMGVIGINSNPLARKIILGTGLFFFIIGTIFMFMLPMPSNFSFGTYFDATGATS